MSRSPATLLRPTRDAAVAGSFYPGRGDQLRSTVRRLLDDCRGDDGGSGAEGVDRAARRLRILRAGGGQRVWSRRLVAWPGSDAWC